MENKKPTLIVPRNDLESKAICEIARKIGFTDIRVSNQGWGARLKEEPPETFENLNNKELLIIEIPGIQKEKELRQKGFTVEIIDHHFYSDHDDRSNEKSSLEQFAEKYKHDLTPYEKMVAVNDRSYIWGLIEEGFSYEEILSVRKSDFRAQGWEDSDFARCIQEYERIKSRLNEYHKNGELLFMHETDFCRTGYLVDLFHLPDEAACQAIENKSGIAKQNILLIKCTTNKCTTNIEVVFSGTAQLRDLVRHEIYPFAESMWWGGSKGFGYTGARIKPFYSFDAVKQRLGSLSKVYKDAEADEIVKSSSRVNKGLHDAPLEKFTSFFILPFHYQPNTKLDPDSIWEPTEFTLPVSGAKVSKSYDIAKHYAEYIYFHDYVRSFLFKIKPDEAVKRLDSVMPAEAGIQNCLSSLDRAKTSLCAHLRRTSRKVRSAAVDSRLRLRGNDGKQQGGKDSAESVKFYRCKLPPLTIAEIETIEEKDNRIDPKRLIAFVNGIHMYVYPGDMAILVFETDNFPEMDAEKCGPLTKLEHPIIENGSDVLLFNNMFRRIYPSYFEKEDFAGNLDLYPQQVSNRDFPLSVSFRSLESGTGHHNNHPLLGDFKTELAGTRLERHLNEKHYPAISPHLEVLIKSFLGRENFYGESCFSCDRLPCFYPILDDRMLVHTYVAFEKFATGDLDPKDGDQTTRDVYFSRLLFIDNPGEDYRYEKKFIRELMKNHSYTRWEQYNTKIGATRYSTAYQLYGHEPIVYRPFSTMYFQMFLLITYYRCRLILFSEEVAAIARKFNAADQKQGYIKLQIKRQFRELHTKFMQFMNIYWFTEATNQDQGIEVFQLMRQSFELEPMYNQVKEEIQRADELVDLIHNEKVEKFNTTAGLLGMIIGFLAVFTGFFGMNLPSVADIKDVAWTAWVSSIVAVMAGAALLVLIVRVRFTPKRAAFIIFLLIVLVVLTWVLQPIILDFFINLGPKEGL